MTAPSLPPSSSLSTTFPACLSASIPLSRSPICRWFLTRVADRIFGEDALVLIVARGWRLVPSLYAPVYAGNLQCHYRHP